MVKGSIANMNNLVLQIIPREHNFDFHRTTGETWRAGMTCSDQPRPLMFSRRKNDVFLKQPGVWRKKDKYHDYYVDENNRYAFDFIDTS
jgi:hypothetical protein